MRPAGAAAARAPLIPGACYAACMRRHHLVGVGLLVVLVAGLALYVSSDRAPPERAAPGAGAVPATGPSPAAPAVADAGVDAGA